MVEMHRVRVEDTESDVPAAVRARGESHVDGGTAEIDLRQAPIRFDAIARAVFSEIIPRLELAKRAERAAPPATALDELSAPDVVELASLAMSQDAGSAAAFAREMQAQGMSLQAVYLNLLAPAARRLGALWEEDLCDIADVTLGLWRLRMVLHELGPDFRGPDRLLAQGRRILLLTGPGETHGFGIAMVADFFRRAGWDVWSEGEVAVPDLDRTMATDWFDVVGFSVANDDLLDELARVIRNVRRLSRNRGVGVMVGGAAFHRTPERVALVGADATAVDGKQAIVQAERLLGVLVART